jgi:hypothetical protein
VRVAVAVATSRRSSEMVSAAESSASTDSPLVNRALAPFTIVGATTSHVMASRTLGGSRRPTSRIEAESSVRRRYLAVGCESGRRTRLPAGVPSIRWKSAARASADPSYATTRERGA